MAEIRTIDGGLAVDDRGTVSFVNAFDFVGVKRFYKLTNFSTDVIRAFHGHLKEGKYVYVVKGAIILAAVKLDDVKNPDRSAPVQRFVLSVQKPSIVFVPPRLRQRLPRARPGHRGDLLLHLHAGGVEGGHYRFPADHWGAKVWEVENR